MDAPDRGQRVKGVLYGDGKMPPPRMPGSGPSGDVRGARGGAEWGERTSTQLSKCEP
jgi:hypothetical protein